MKLRFLAPAILCFLVSVAGAFGQTRNVAIHVRETAGIRRSGYPVNIRVPFAKGAVTDREHFRLMLGEREVALQVTPETRWPDQSIQWLDVDFNATVAPGEAQEYRLEYGGDIKSQATARGLSVNATADSIQVGNVRFGPSAYPLMLSVSYRQEDIGKGINGFSVVDAAGSSHELMGNVKADVVRKGPLYVVVRYIGTLALDASYSVPFVITAEMPNSKTWVKYTARIEDSAKRVRSIAFNSSLALGAFPWLWDFGTGSWSYGSFRNSADSVVLTQTVKNGGAAEWEIRNGAKGQEQSYETSAGPRPRLPKAGDTFRMARK